MRVGSGHELNPH